VPFGDHLGSKLDLLVAEQLVEAMRAVVLRGAMPEHDRRTFYRLEAAGLAREESGRVVAANHVYQKCFQTVL